MFEGVWYIGDEDNDYQRYRIFIAIDDYNRIHDKNHNNLNPRCYEDDDNEKINNKDNDTDDQRETDAAQLMRRQPHVAQKGLLMTNIMRGGKIKNITRRKTQKIMWGEKTKILCKEENQKYYDEENQKSAQK